MGFLSERAKPYPFNLADFNIKRMAQQFALCLEVYTYQLILEPIGKFT
jgi:hypothetical protein